MGKLAKVSTLDMKANESVTSKKLLNQKKEKSLF